MKIKILSLLGCAGSVIASLFGGWDAALVTLLIFMGVDYVTGLIVAGVSIPAKRRRTGRWKAVPGGKVFAGKVLPCWWFWWLAALI